MKNNDFMNKRLTKDAGEAFSPARYSLKSGNDAIISPYKTYELFFEITFMVIQKLGAYEDIGTPDECLEAMRTARAYQAQYLDNIKDLPEAVHRRQEAGDTGAGCEECTSGSEQYKQNS